MLTLSDLKAKANARKATQALMAAVAPLAQPIADKLKSVAEAAKEAVTAAFPASNGSIEKQVDFVFGQVAALEQRVDGLEEFTGHETVVDVQQVQKRVSGLRALMEASEKTAKEQKKEDKAVRKQNATPVTEAPAAKPDVKAPVQGVTGQRKRLRLNENAPRNK